MPGITCAVAICKTNIVKARESGEIVSFFVFPKEKRVRKEWMRRCYRKEKFDPVNKRICSKHFVLSDFEDAVGAKITGRAPRKLKKYALPSQFLKPEQCDPEAQTQSLKRVKRLEKRQQKELVRKLLNESYAIGSAKTSSDEEDENERNAWDRQSVRLLIKEYKKFRQEFNNPEARKRMYWEKVQANLAAKGYNFDVEQCEKKWRNLRKTFKDNEGKQVVTWVYYNALKDIFSAEHQTSGQKRSLEEAKNGSNDIEMEMGEDYSLRYDTEDDDESSPPNWFLNFLRQYREDEKKKMKMLEDMHSDIVKLENQKCALLKTLIDRLS